MASVEAQPLDRDLLPRRIADDDVEARTVAAQEDRGEREPPVECRLGSRSAPGPTEHGLHAHRGLAFDDLLGMELLKGAQVLIEKRSGGRDIVVVVEPGSSPRELEFELASSSDVAEFKVIDRCDLGGPGPRLFLVDQGKQPDHRNFTTDADERVAVHEIRSEIAERQSRNEAVEPEPEPRQLDGHLVLVNAVDAALQDDPAE